MAAGRSVRSKAELISASEPGTRNAPPKPWMTRPVTSIAGESAVAANTEPIPKVASPKRMTGRRPNRSEMEPPGRIVDARASK